MRKLLLSGVATVVWLGLAAVAALADGQGPPVPVSSTGRSIDAVDVQSAPAHPAKPVHRTPTWVIYSFFFGHLDLLDRTAEEQEKLGKKSAAEAWRSHEQLAASLDAWEGEVLKEVAYECLQALKDKDAQIQMAVAAFREQHPDGAFVTAPVPPELHAMWQERIEIIEGQIDRLRLSLGDDRFLALDAYVRKAIVPVEVPLSAEAVTTRGESQ